MNRKITDFVLGGKLGGFGASGLTRFAAWPGGSRDPSAIAPNPLAARTSTSRRVNAGRQCSQIRSGNIHELIPVQQRQTHVSQRSTACKKVLRQPFLGLARHSTQRETPGRVDLAGRAVTLAIALQTVRERARLFLHKIAIEQ